MQLTLKGNNQANSAKRDICASTSADDNIFVQKC